jgi:hypothetical protein
MPRRCHAVRPRANARRAADFGRGLEIAQVHAPGRFVIATGGDYFFVARY